MARNTPPLHAKGIYQLRDPWSASSNTLYECIAIRSFADFILKGQDVFSSYYEPKSLDRSQYEADLAEGAHIITLKSETSAMIFVPDTYIQSFPDVSGRVYKRVVLSLLLDPLPEGVDLTHLKTSMAELVSDVVGVTSGVNEHLAPYSGVVTEMEHTVLEAAREAKITNRTTDHARLLGLQEQVDAQRVTIEELQNEIIRLTSTP